jgi:LacI family transcriptional regulator
MTASGEALLFVNRRNPLRPNAPFVGIDNRRAGADVAAFLHARGIDQPGILHGDCASSATADRIAGFADALAPAGGAPRSATAAGLEHMEIGYRHALDVLSGTAGRRGIFCLSDLIAYGAHRRLAEAGLRVPQDVVLVGFDDNPLNDWVAPWLSSVRVPYDRFGPAVVAGLREIAQGRDVDTVLEHRLVVRGA